MPKAAPPLVIPEAIAKALSRCRVVTQQAKVSEPGFWLAQIRAHPTVDFPKALLAAEAWCVSNPVKAPKRDFARFLHSWFGREAERA